MDGLGYGLNLLLAYLIMLVAMTYNVGFFIVILTASVVGHVLFADDDGPQAAAPGSGGSSEPEQDCCEGDT